MVTVRADLCWAADLWINTQERRAGLCLRLLAMEPNATITKGDVTHGDGVPCPVPNSGHDFRQNSVGGSFLRVSIRWHVKMIMRELPGRFSEDEVKRNLTPQPGFPENFWDSADRIDLDFVSQFL